MPDFVSRAGQKLDHALTTFSLDVTGLTCADLGSNTGGFVDCLLRRGAAKVYSLDTGYGVLDYKLRKDPRVVVMERTNAMHATLPELVRFISIDVAWTKQKHILPAAARMLGTEGAILTLIKPHYEAPKGLLRKGILPHDALPEVLDLVRSDITRSGFAILAETQSPITGAKGNVEYLAHLKPVPRA